LSTGSIFAAVSASKPACSTISRALASSMPTLGSTATLGQRVRALDGELLDVHAALLGAHGQVGAVRAVEQDREVVLLGDAGALGDHHLVHGVALDVHAEDRTGVLLRLVGGLGDLDAAGLAAAPDLDLGLDHGHPATGRADALGRLTGLFRCRGDGPGEHGHTVLLEHVTGLVLEEIHGAIRPCCWQ
jgi:hypothetical protein